MFKRTIFSLFFILCAGAAFSQSQQLTRVAVVNMSRVYNEFFQESRAVREFEARTANVQAEINRMTLEIQELRNRRTNAIAMNNQTEVNRLENEINSRTENLRNYASARQAELDRERQQLNQSSTFLNQVHEEVRYVAESEGFTVVFDTNTSGLIWYLPMFDLTDKVIQGLRSRSR